MTYRYTIEGIDVNPRGEWSISNDQNAGQIFFRRNLTGDLTFIGTDYDLIMGMTECETLEFIIYCGVTEFWTGQFKFPSDFDVDEDSCAMTGTPEVVDEYSCIMENYETKYDVRMFIGGLAPDLRDCLGALIQTLTVSFPIGVPGAGVMSTDVLNTLIRGVNFMNCDHFDLRSSFMWRDNFPNGTNYAGAYGANNYITGAANRLEYVYLRHNSANRTGWGGTACDIPTLMSFKDFEDMLRNRFNAYWYIDQNGDFRIEHIRFFDAAFVQSDFETGINLKTLIANVKESYAFRRNKYTYETGELYDQEHWTWQHWEGTEGGMAHGQDFEGVPIFYGAAVGEKSDCVPGEFKEKEIATPNFWSDVEWGWGLATVAINPAGSARPDTIGCPGWLMLDIDTATGWIRCETGALSGAPTVNAHVSTANLQEAYFTWDRIFLDGDMNSGNVILFDSEIRKKLQEAIEFERCCSTEFDPLDFVETEMGSGKVKAATEKLRSIDIELLY